jgi:hypothetical protein
MCPSYPVGGGCSCELSQNVIYEGLDEDGFANFLDSIWTTTQKTKTNMDTDYFCFNSRTDAILSESLVEARESASEYLECI